MAKNLKTIFKPVVSLIFITLLFCQQLYGNELFGSFLTGHGIRFNASQHNRINNTALAKVLKDLKINLDQQNLKRWEKILNKATWHQDLLNFFSAPHHFENCCLPEGIAQINKHLTAIEADYLRLRQSITLKQQSQLKEKIIFRSGRILHSVQDFFAHSNFVELMQEKHSTIEEVLTPDFWTPNGQGQILQLIKNGLISEKFFFSFPRRCQGNSTNYRQLGKDNPKKAGGKKIINWRNRHTGRNFTGFEAAMYVAEKSTYHVLFQLFSKFRLLTETLVIRKSGHN